MKKILSVLLAGIMAFIGIVGIVDASVYVHGYTKANGTYVSGYYRSIPDSNPYNNYSYPGNTNPYTGVTATGNPSTYLNNYYGSTYSSPSYTPSYTPTPSYYVPTTPTCPSMAYYDSLSSSCKCMSGYVVDTDILGKQSCVSGLSKCWKDYGSMSTYDSLAKQCKCYSGYTMSGGKCISNDTNCQNLFGYGTKYNSLKANCECKLSYKFDGKKCVYDSSITSYDYSNYLPLAAASLTTPLANEKNRDYCVRVYGANSNNSDNANGTFKCVCKAGYAMRNNKCMEYQKICEDAFSKYSIFSSYSSKDEQPLCTCQKGYVWDDPVKMTKCVKN
jgi:hypothetical protein